jgi:mono/diheme cytochrome c family protein
MKVEDVLDVRAYLETFEPVKAKAPTADIPFAFLIRRGIGLWKWLGLDTKPLLPDPAHSESWNRGAYLVNGPGHCGECHTPRTLILTTDSSKFLAGGPHPEGDGKVPSLRDLIGRKRYKDVADLALALEFGETMGYDKMSAGGMGAVQTNMSKLPKEDITAIAEYLASIK